MTKNKASGIEVHCSHTKLVDITELVPNPNNPNTHPDKQIALLAKIIRKQGWRSPIVVSKLSGFIVKGHGRYEASKLLNVETVPVDFQDYDNPASEHADLLADNRIAELAVVDEDKLSDLLNNDSIFAGFDIELTGFELSEIPVFDSDGDVYDKYDEGEKGSMTKNFGVPPFSILDTRQGYWQERKKKWNEIIGDQGETRENTLAANGSVMESIGSVSLLDATLAEIICRWFGLEGFKAFDCFAGDTVFGFICASLGMDFTGIELRKEQADINNKRVNDAGLPAKYICDDAINMNKHIEDNSIDLFFSCPPYADLEVYSDDPKDLSNMEHDDFFKVYKTALSNTYSKLKDNRFAIITISEVRNKNGCFINLVPKTIDIMTSAGYKFYNELILVNSAGTLPLRAGKSMNSSRKVGRMHQNVLVFYKGSIKKIKSEFGDVLGGWGEEQEQK
jgi:16S rRNA G966 N2-methylase RsmD/CBS domain-containing protein